MAKLIQQAFCKLHYIFLDPPNTVTQPTPQCGEIVFVVAILNDG